MLCKVKQLRTDHESVLAGLVRDFLSNFIGFKFAIFCTSSLVVCFDGD